MTPQTELEIKGNFFTHPFVELITEIRQARLNGSLRLADKEKKSVFYFKAGRIVFAVSNARSSRLYEIMLQRNRLTKDDVLKIPNYSHDFEFAGFLEENGLLKNNERNQLFVEQIADIIIEALSWNQGEWTFSSLMRIRDGLSFEINIQAVSVDYARCLPADHVLSRFRSLDNSISKLAEPGIDVPLHPHESFILSRIPESPVSAAEIVSLAGMPESQALHALYVLWIAGLISRKAAQPAFSEPQIALMRGAKLELKKEAKHLEISKPDVKEVEPIADDAPPSEPDITISLEDYLEQVESAQTYYDILGVDIKAEADELKRAYFYLAKNFHPDRYHSEGGENLRRIQKAFTELAQAHETLKNPETREIYDYRMRKEIADREKQTATGNTGQSQIQADQAAQNFETGFSLLMDGENESSLPFLARAVHFAPRNARYHAYYGKALSTDEKQRHKAENEMQTALKLDPGNPTFRILLAEFFVHYNLLKRAEGELTRLLEVFPSNKEARALLDKLQK